jgi:dihydrofolate reductase
MRRLVYYVACTLDGFIARQDGSFHECFLFEGEHFPGLFRRFPETFPAHLRQRLGIAGEAQRFDAVLMGRHTYEVGLREGITSPYAPLRQYLVSRTMLVSPDETVELFGGDPLDLVRRLKTQPGKDIWLCGGSQLASAVAGEIDELILKINPFLIGQGIPLFQAPTGVLAAKLIEHTAYPNGFVLARYSLAH